MPALMTYTTMRGTVIRSMPGNHRLSLRGKLQFLKHRGKWRKLPRFPIRLIKTWR